MHALCCCWQERLAKTESCLVASREDLSLKQVHAVGLEARVLQAESALRAGSSLLQVSAPWACCHFACMQRLVDAANAPQLQQP